ncbi:unnamed protein product [Paramecium octaurelia]|uniref:Uncharacterized protein n=1 Tax=Paramecium octaurelia TaxID=43137 RepID=A0A8S1T654_PAROT|nr:unnamed protein product [Paramecium octaurelia]
MVMYMTDNQTTNHLGNMCIRMEFNMWDILKKISQMDMEKKSGQIELVMKGYVKMEKTQQGNIQIC